MTSPLSIRHAHLAGGGLGVGADDLEIAGEGMADEWRDAM
jgi:hypothetical protein